MLAIYVLHKENQTAAGASQQADSAIYAETGSQNDAKHAAHKAQKIEKLHTSQSQAKTGP